MLSSLYLIVTTKKKIAKSVQRFSRFALRNTFYDLFVVGSNSESDLVQVKSIRPTIRISQNLLQIKTQPYRTFILIHRSRGNSTHKKVIFITLISVFHTRIKTINYQKQYISIKSKIILIANHT